MEDFFFISFHFSAKLLEDVSNGKITQYMLFPTKLIGFYLTRDLGLNLFIHMINLITTIGIILFFSNLFIFTSILNFGLFILFLPITYFILLLTEILFGSIAFFLPWGWGVLSLSSDITRVLGGSSFPLSIFSFTIPLLAIFPAFTYYHPMQIYLGKYSSIETVYVFAGGIFWCVALYFLAKWVFKMGLKRNEAVGL